MIIVGKTAIIDKKSQKQRVYRYSDIPTDEEKWVYELTYMPIPFDLMHLRFVGVSYVKSGWWTGKEWEGRLLKPEDHVIAWKRNHDFE